MAGTWPERSPAADREAPGCRTSPPTVSDTGSCLLVRCRLVREEVEGVLEGGLQHGVAVAGAAGRAGEVDDERGADRPGRATRELRVRGVMQGVRAQRL